MSQAQAFSGANYKKVSHPLPPTVGGDVHQAVKEAKKKAGIAFDDEIPHVGPELFILRLKGETRLTFTIWAERPRGVWTHWDGQGTAPHFRDEDECPGCQKHQEKRWKGFLHCYCSEKRQEVFLELTPASARSLKDQLNDRASMRGAVIQVKRTTADNGRLYISTLTRNINVEGLPPEKDPRLSVMRLWGMSEQDCEKWLQSEVGTGGDAQFV